MNTTMYHIRTHSLCFSETHCRYF